MKILKRKIEKEINNWCKSQTKTALLVDGARQVGKTYTIRNVLNSNGYTFYEFNLFDNRDFLEMLKTSLDGEAIIKKIKSLLSLTVENNIFIFIDEIELYPDIITKIKFMVDKSNFKFILSGSLLGVEINNIRSVPVGYLEVLQMYPLTFFEFIQANNISDEAINYLKECFENLKPIDIIWHKKLLQLFYLFLIVGGMPACVATLLDNGDLVKISNIQQNIILLYKNDFAKYETENKRLRLIEIYDNIPSQLNKQNLKFSFTLLNKELKFNRYEESFLWLKDAGVVYPAYISTEPRIPLQMSKEKNNFKLFYSDVGLLSSKYGPGFREKLLYMNAQKDVNCGAIFENFVCQELVANKLTPYYYKSKKIGEIDFLIELEGKVIPFEVKSGSDYKKHLSMDHLLKEKELNIEKGYLLSLSNIEVDGNLVYLPIYLIDLIKEKEISPAVKDLRQFLF